MSKYTHRPVGRSRYDLQPVSELQGINHTKNFTVVKTIFISAAFFEVECNYKRRNYSTTTVHMCDFTSGTITSMTQGAVFMKGVWQNSDEQS
jgi:hypothetical protein